MSQYGRENAANLTRRSAGHKPAPDFTAINKAALGVLPALCARWLPDGRRQVREWVARNPRREDRRPGSFKVDWFDERIIEHAVSPGFTPKQAGSSAEYSDAYLRGTHG